MEHAVIRTHIDNIPPIFVFDEKGLVFYILIDQVVVFRRHSHQGRGGVNHISHAPGLKSSVAVIINLPAPHCRDDRIGETRILILILASYVVDLPINLGADIAIPIV